MTCQVGSKISNPRPLPDEIWKMVGHLIPGSNKQIFYTLTKVSRRFNRIFSPFLYEKYTLMIDDDSRSGIQAPSFLRYVKDLEVIVRVGNYHYPYPIPNDKSFAASILKEYLNAMVELRSFSFYDDIDCGKNRKTLFTSENQGVFDDLIRNMPGLKEVSISMSTRGHRSGSNALRTILHMIHHEVRDNFKWHPLTMRGFCHLTSLELYSLTGLSPIKGTERSELSDLVDVLAACPRLTTLGLGIVTGYDEETNELSIWKIQSEFLSRVCNSYAKKPGALPLALVHLRLGPGVLVGSSALGELFTTERLETLQLSNSEVSVVHHNRMGAANDNLTNIVDKNKCPLLRQLWISHLTLDVVEWIDSVKDALPMELVLTEDAGDSEDYFDEQALASRLSLYYFRDQWELLRALECEVLSTIVSLSGEFDSNNIKAWPRLVDLIRNAPQLTYLSLQQNATHYGPYPSVKSSPWPNIKDPKWIAQRYAKVIVANSSTIMFIEIGNWAWKVKRIQKTPTYDSVIETSAEDETGQLDGEDKWDCTLEELDWEEKREIYLFNLPELIRASPLGVFH